MNVPVMGATTPIQVPGRFAPETPHITPVGEEAAGTNIGAAQAKLGSTISGVSAELGAHIVAKQNFDNEQKSNDAATSMLNDLHDFHDKINQNQGIKAEGNYNAFVSQ